MPDYATESEPPVYCSVDGMALLDKRTTLSTGFDPYTGIERSKREVVSRECPTEGHDKWVLVPHKLRGHYGIKDNATWTKA